VVDVIPHATSTVRARRVVLATAPAGIAEMVLTGRVLGLDSTVIAGFQLMRVIIVLIWCRTALQLFGPLADWVFGKKE